MDRFKAREGIAAQAYGDLAFMRKLCAKWVREFRFDSANLNAQSDNSAAPG
jgi:hypothetical protein